MDGRTDQQRADRPRPAGHSPGGPATGRGPGERGDGRPGQVPLVGRHDVLQVLDESLDEAADGVFRFVALAGEPGAGKTRLLGELTAGAVARKLAVSSGRAAEFEQEMPFGAVVDALDDHLEEHLPELGPATVKLLLPVFPALASVVHGTMPTVTGNTPVARYQLFRAVRRLLEQLAAEDGLVLILDDVHWADEATIELLDYLVRHPPRARVMIAVAFRPAQASARLAALVEASVQGACGHRVRVRPLTEDEVAQLLGPDVTATRCRELFEASGGNPFYLEALARSEEPLAEGPREGDMPPAVRAALQMELSGLSPDALRVARGAAVAADEFAPALAAVAAEVSDPVALSALDELVARDIVRPGAGRFRFRHPLVRHAAYGSAAAGWRLAAHARIATYLAEIGAPAAVRARHVERSGRVGDRPAIATLVEAGRAYATQAPVTAGHWLKAALRLMPENAPAGAGLPSRLDLLMELAQVQSVGGALTEGRETARTLLRLLPGDAYERRAKAARLAALMERQLDRPHEARSLLLDELRNMPDPRSPAAIPLRMRLVAERTMRLEFRAAQAVLDLMPDDSDDWEPSLKVAVAALRPMPAFAGGRVADALRYAEAADRLLHTAPNEHLADWMDAIAWLCWAETMLGRYRTAARHFERALDVARDTGQLYVVTNLLAGLARSYGTLGNLAQAASAAEDSVEEARLVASGQQIVFALTQQSLVATWSGNEETALRHADEAVATGAGVGEWWGSMAHYARAMALFGLGRQDEGVQAIMKAANGFDTPTLDQRTLLSCAETLAQVEAGRGRRDAALQWAERAQHMRLEGVDSNNALADLARAHALLGSDPAEAARAALTAAEALEAAGERIDAGRARLRAGTAYAETGDRKAAREQLRIAAETFQACGARTLHGQAAREQRRVGVRVPAPGGRGSGPGGLSKREYEVASLVAEGYTNSQIAERLFVSVRTVETHLSHIFTKLGVSSRVGVVSALNRGDSGRA
ncbi:helix-turn-helix transcriptional regulator [Actinomadura harenae]